MANTLFKTGMLIMLLILFSACNKTEIFLLCKEEDSEIKFDEYYLIKNHPKEEIDLDELLKEFNQDLITSTKYGQRTFLKQHSSIDNAFTFGDKIDYEKNKCDEIDNMDMLCSVSKVKFQGHGDTIIFYYYK